MCYGLFDFFFIAILFFCFFTLSKKYLTINLEIYNIANFESKMFVLVPKKFYIIDDFILGLCTIFSYNAD